MDVNNNDINSYNYNVKNEKYLRRKVLVSEMKSFYDGRYLSLKLLLMKGICNEMYLTL
jgi:hypothetical protein